MNQIVLTTYDWVPDGPRGHVRDIRLRWALEEAGLPYRVESVSFEERGPAHLARQPFGQVPFLTDGPVKLFESGACLLHVAEQSEALMPTDPVGRAEVVQWVISALNSIEMVSVPWWFIGLSKPEVNPLGGWLDSRLDRLEAALDGRDWFAAGRFTAADLLMADVLRVPAVRRLLATRPGLTGLVERCCARPAFEKARADQMAHFAAADVERAG